MALKINFSIETFKQYSLAKRIGYAAAALVGTGLLIYLSIQTGGALPAAFMIGCSLYPLWCTGSFMVGFGLTASLFMNKKQSHNSFYENPRAVFK